MPRRGRFGQRPAIALTGLTAMVVAAAPAVHALQHHGARPVRLSTASTRTPSSACSSTSTRPPSQQTELVSLVSEETGEPITRTTLEDAKGFGLGVIQTTTAKFGTVWTYEGATFGFRALHVYFPSSGVIIAMTVNSQPTQDAISELALSVYNTLLSHGLISPASGPAGDAHQ
jgi:D-alanyl-D-alanine carboxypeptidase